MKKNEDLIHIFTHFMVINCLVSWLENKETMVSFYPDNCSITKLEISNGLVNLSKKEKS